MPTWFLRRYPEVRERLSHNARALVTPLDWFFTLRALVTYPEGVSRECVCVCAVCVLVRLVLPLTAVMLRLHPLTHTLSAMSAEPPEAPLTEAQLARGQSLVSVKVGYDRTCAEAGIVTCRCMSGRNGYQPLRVTGAMHAWVKDLVGPALNRVLGQCDCVVVCVCVCVCVC